MNDTNKQFQDNLPQIIAESTRKMCEHCGCEYWDTVTTQVEISALRSPTGKSEILLVGVLVCHNCGKENVARKVVAP